jgi:hypothetical protein
MTLRSLEEVRLGVQHPVVQAPLIGLVEQQVEVLERLGQPERLFRILKTIRVSIHQLLREMRDKRYVP